MKLWKSVTVLAWVVLLLIVGMLISLPFRFPGGIISWDGIARFSWPIPILCILLSMGLLVNPRAFRMLVLGTGVITILLVIAGYLSLFPEIIFIAALIALDLSADLVKKRESVQGI